RGIEGVEAGKAFLLRAAPRLLYRLAECRCGFEEDVEPLAREIGLRLLEYALDYMNCIDQGAQAQHPRVPLQGMQAAEEGVALILTDPAALLDGEEGCVQLVELIASFIAKLAEE